MSDSLLIVDVEAEGSSAVGAAVCSFLGRDNCDQNSQVEVTKLRSNVKEQPCFTTWIETVLRDRLEIREPDLSRPMSVFAFNESRAQDWGWGTGHRRPWPTQFEF